MEYNEIEQLLERYFDGETTIAEEQELRAYFASPNVASHLVQYQSVFDYFSFAKEQEFAAEIPRLPESRVKKSRFIGLSIAASVVVLIGIGSYLFVNNNIPQSQDLGTYNDPEIAFRETQKALALLSNHVNAGIESVRYIEEYQNSKNLIFKQY